MVLVVRGALRVVVALAAAGCASRGAPRYHGPPSDHFDGKRFHNQVRFEDHQIEDAIRRETHAIAGKRGYWDGWQGLATDSPPPYVGGDTLRVVFVNHSTVLVQVAGLNILTDPIWSKRASPLSWYGPRRHRPPGIRFEDLPPIDVVVVSHNHYDHMDLPTLRRLAATFHPRILTGLGNARYLARHGVADAEDVDWWQSVAIRPGVRITGVPAQHWSARSIGDKWRTLWLGFVVETPSGSVYFAGDTGMAEFFSRIRERFPRLRLALLPIAPERPRRAMAPRHMSADDAVRADEVLGACTALAIHFGTFQQGDDAEDEPPSDLRRAVAREDSAGRGPVRFWALRNGEARLVPPLCGPVH